MKKEINKILEDLYIVDESLMAHEKDLKKIIEKLLAVAPNTRFDNNFAKKLKKELLGKNYKNSFIINFNFMKKLSFVAGGLTVIALALVVSLYFINKEDVIIADLGKFKITKVAPNAFGLLAQAPSQVESGMPRTQSGGGGGGGLGLGAALPQGEMAVDSKMIAPMPPYYSIYKYVYVGEDFEIKENQMAVLKRVMNNSIGRQLASFARKINLGLLDLSRFTDVSVQSINLAEDKDFGYMASIDLINEQVYISENWNKWKNPMNECRDQNCYESLRLKPEDMPANEEIVKIADEFLREFNIQRDIYGEGEVEDDFRLYYAKVADTSSIYIPENITVVYPLMINGEKVYEEGGNKNGLRVNVNIREKKAAGVYGLSSQNYESSMYDVITDVVKIKNMVEQGGLYPNRYYSEGADIKEIKVGTPILSYVKMWKYENNMSSELLVPALIFPIDNFSELDNFYQKNLIIPLAKEIIEERMNPVDPPIMILESGSGGGVSSSEATTVEAIKEDIIK